MVRMVMMVQMSRSRTSKSEWNEKSMKEND